MLVKSFYSNGGDVQKYFGNQISKPQKLLGFTLLVKH